MRKEKKPQKSLLKSNVSEIYNQKRKRVNERLVGNIYTASKKNLIRRGYQTPQNIYLVNELQQFKTNATVHGIELYIFMKVPLNKENHKRDNKMNLIIGHSELSSNGPFI